MGLFSKKPAARTPLDGVDTVLADLDGVVYAGPGALPHAVESLNRAAVGARLGYITNNASRTDASVAEHLSSLGLTVAPSDVVTSPQAAMRLLAELVPAPATILVVGGDGLVDELQKAGYTVTRSADDSPAAVVQGFAPEVAWTDLAEAAFALKQPEDEGGIPWIATNTDWTIPRERGVAPGNGTLVSAVHTAIGRLATVAGKPEVPIFEEAKARFGATHPLFIGDRLDTDILGANRAGIESALVLTGIDRPKHVLAAPEGSRPTYILRDLRDLHEPYPLVTEKDGAHWVSGAGVRVRGGDVEIIAEGDEQIDLLRAGAAAIWASGTPVFVLRVPERLYDDPFHRP
ncbi:HAD-IIA family hydrolase [Streptomyces sp. AC495_CC817]|uniref:HAD-IIA family hydrolase n=1 Tax=Streptomyces sp. AC495_CC817 TaxID=2823900 RepID=UPI001C2734C1|nr:HAD-IIA family hydrolase [Streptomyces sp. AC495_CC817]